MSFRAYLDESSANRGDDQQEYLVCAAILPEDACDAARDCLRPLLLPGQIKFHWTDESDVRKHEIVAQIVALGSMNVVVAHLDARLRKVERYRRKCLEVVYYELLAMGVFDVVLESRSPKQDKSDRAHIVGLQGQGLDKRIRITHQRGGDEPLLWIADAVLGSINAAHLGEASYYEALNSTLIVESRTSESRLP